MDKPERKKSRAPWKTGSIKRGPCPEILYSPNFKSSYERNVYRVLIKLGFRPQYEARRFDFPSPYRKAHEYTPDFLCMDPVKPGNTYFEVKGWMDGASKTKLLGFKKYFPFESSRLIIVTVKKNFEWIEDKIGCEMWDYRELRRQVSGLVAWED